MASILVNWDFYKIFEHSAWKKLFFRQCLRLQSNEAVEENTCRNEYSPHMVFWLPFQSLSTHLNKNYEVPFKSGYFWK